MDFEKYLILIKNEDKTEQVRSIYDNKVKYEVEFYNSSKTYNYGHLSIGYYKDPEVIYPINYLIYENNQPLSGVEKILIFNQYVKIVFKSGYKKLCQRSSIIIEETCLKSRAAYSCFDYLKSLADYVGIKVEDDTSFLSKQYNKIACISPRSVLAAYLEKKPLGSLAMNAQPIFPFGFNLSQKEAVEKAISNQVSVIEGPPGTGKTQTILNIIANAVINNKTVAVVSNNNSATANVLEKLQKYDTDFVAAYLGNKENREAFLERQKGFYPDMNGWAMPFSDFQTIKEKLNESQKKLNEMLEYQNSIAVLKTELSAIQTEAKYFEEYYKSSNASALQMSSFLSINSQKTLSLMIEYKASVDKGSYRLIKKLYNLLVYGIYNFKFYDNSPELIIAFLQKSFYERRIKELTDQIEKLSMRLENFSFDNAMKEYSGNSMKLFKARLAERYGLDSRRKIFDKDELWKDFASFVKEYPVTLSTTHSLRSCASENYIFDYVIVDEASQVDLVAGALALSCAQNAVIVGDLKQLPNVVSSDIDKITRRIFSSYELDSAYSYADNSLLSSVLSLYKDIPKTLLREHYRCHPKIIGFCNQKFYKNQLIILTNQKDDDKPLLLYKTAKGKHARGKLNQRQIDVVFKEVFPEQRLEMAMQSVGVIAPYRLQANELQKTIGERDIEVDTVHKYQGREKDVIILTTVVNDLAPEDFVDNPNLVNVAVSRAVDKLIVVASDSSEEWIGTNIGDLVSYIKYNNFEIVESDIYSVFDLLYSSYSDKLLKYLKRYKSVSEHKSENLMNIIVEKVLEQPEFQGLGRVIHQPLKMLIKDPVKLDEEECIYAMNILTHADFVIFNKVDKRPVLVVEVDGYAYHASNPKQLERDRMKDGILRKYGIPILRIKTNESGEEEKLRSKLMEILKISF